MQSATARAPSNIAFVKYWGNIDHGLRLPFNDSVSMNLDAASSTTTVTFDPDLDADRLWIDGTERRGAARERVSEHLDRIRDLSGLRSAAGVRSHNTFPMGTGIASSASAFAALTLAATAAAGVDMDRRGLSSLARCGSGSAARSMADGFVRWHSGADHADSWSESIADADHWDLRDLVAIVSRRHKAVGSTGGHRLATTSPHYAARQRGICDRVHEVCAAVRERDAEKLGDHLEADALELHAIALTSSPSVLYWDGATLDVMHGVRAWRGDGLGAWFTLDAGPNVHVICEGTHAGEVERRLRSIAGVQDVLHNRAAPGARLLNEEAEADLP